MHVFRVFNLSMTVGSMDRPMDRPTDGPMDGPTDGPMDGPNLS